MSNCVQPHRRQPTRLTRPWDSPGNNTGVGCHFLLQCIKVKVKSLSLVWVFATPWITHARPPCPSPIPRVYSNLCPSSRMSIKFCQILSLFLNLLIQWITLVGCERISFAYLELNLLGHLIGEGDSTPLQYSCLENPMDGGAW